MPLTLQTRVVNNLLQNLYNFAEFSYAIAYALTMICIVMAIALFTVLQRKILAAIQRKPNALGLIGPDRAVTSRLKLFSKKTVRAAELNYYFFSFSPSTAYFTQRCRRYYQLQKQVITHFSSVSSSSENACSSCKALSLAGVKAPTLRSFGT